jgi:hypothetical protein
MIDHVYISVTNIEKSLAFYGQALKPLVGSGLATRQTTSSSAPR